MPGKRGTVLFECDGCFGLGFGWGGHVANFGRGPKICIPIFDKCRTVGQFRALQLRQSRNSPVLPLEVPVRSKAALSLGVVAATAIVAAANPARRSLGTHEGVGPSLGSIGTLAFGPGGVLYAADPQSATIYAIDLGAGATKGTPGTKDIVGVDQQVASMLGTGAAELAITDLVVDPRTHNSYLSVMRGQGTGAKPVCLRIDGLGKIEIVETDARKFSSIALPNSADANPSTQRGNPRMQSVTDMAYVGGRLYVAGLSNEKFSSKLWAVPYPFASADRGTSVGIFHGNHARPRVAHSIFRQ